jgi:hypothetical protein
LGRLWNDHDWRCFIDDNRRRWFDFDDGWRRSCDFDRCFDGLVLDGRRQWGSDIGGRRLRRCMRLDRLDETRRTEDRSSRLGWFGLFGRWRLLRGGGLGRNGVLGEHVAARK